MSDGTPAMQGRPATSAAQDGQKTFPAETDPASIAHVSGLPSAATAVSLPQRTEIRQVRPAAELGMGYHDDENGVH